MFWVTLYLFHRGFRRVMNWLILAFLIFSVWALINYARHPGDVYRPVPVSVRH